MNESIQPLSRAVRASGRGLLAIAFVASAAAAPAGAPVPRADRPVARAAPGEAATFEIRLTDDSKVKAVVLEARFELETRYGKLVIPVADIRRIDFSLRLPEEDGRRVVTAIADLGHPEFRRREAASAELLALRDRAYPALLKAAQGKDREAVHRAEALIEKIRTTVAPDCLEYPASDVVHTKDSRIAGQLKTAGLRVNTLAFGEQFVRLADVRSVQSLAADCEAGDAQPDPGNLNGFHDQAGKPLAFRVTGTAGAGVYGTDVYTTDSPLAVAAVHAGVLRVGQTGTVRVTVVAHHPAFKGTLRNGVTSATYGPYPGYRVESQN